MQQCSYAFSQPALVAYVYDEVMDDERKYQSLEEYFLNLYSLHPNQCEDTICK